MLYGKLPVVFLTTLAAEKDGSTNSVIAEFILENRAEIRDIGIQELAKKCNVSVSSVSRFCREIGIGDFASLRDILNSDGGDGVTFENRSDSAQDYARSICEGIMLAAGSVDMDKIRSLCRDIRDYDSVAVFGLLKSESAALGLQSDLAILGKPTYTKISFRQQMDYIRQADSKDLIIIFSFSGIYFDYEYRRLPESFKCPKICLITGGDNQYGSYIDLLIHFDSTLNWSNHPYQQQFIAGIIAQEYARLIEADAQ